MVASGQGTRKSCHPQGAPTRGHHNMQNAAVRMFDTALLSRVPDRGHRHLLQLVPPLNRNHRPRQPGPRT
ncbi:hypothetical protein XAC3218_910023 [Xanthomonas citri pv. citri]|uniref:Uncharacterized protein n=1 Tax=Xanthomonas citri pv. citri TaxID=611301 RepID=A0A0U5FIA5_XANCI|nr:hypothetical protein XAC902_1040076 [Xanthomonas citri pv. citri]CEE20591.1 hypothetical protein XAC908_1030024 [Xanthomonas citri pv. citri]CEE37470.1 hypothetical protein XAC3824_880076 [Xanthomonas citri pv. citri]CEE48181.1 hypothetical protein XAC2911_790076 [Xanthomonas citri pv. citri]CEE52352.1 hypothetical protein XACS584_1210054 [Xanthomonas citri pv. citri]